MAGPPRGGFTWRDANDPEVLFICGFGSGFVPVAPGTWGSALAVLVWWVLLAPLGVAAQLAVAAGVFGVGTWVVSRVERRRRVGDTGSIVVDEFVGQWLVLLGAPLEPLVALLGFVLFRVFDIWKPWPIRTVERRTGGAFGVMIDDVLAGLFGLAVIQITLWRFPGIVGFGFG